MTYGVRRSIHTSLATIAVVVLAGCGGGGGSTTSGYVAKANTICRTARSETAPLVGRVTSLAGSLSSGSSSVRAQLASTLQRLHIVAAGYLTQLRRLKQPSGDRSAIEAFLTPLAEVVDAIGKAGDAIGRNRVPAALAILQQASPLAQDATAAAHGYGLAQCETLLPALG